MQPITPGQDSTLRRWVSIKGKRRPSKRDRDFLCEEKNLSPEQLDTWWEAIDPSNRDDEVPQQSILPTGEQFDFGLQHEVSTTSVSLEPKDPSPACDPNACLQYQSMDVDFDLFSPASEMQSWSPIKASHENYQFPSQYHTHGSFNSDPWSQDSRTHHRSTTNSTSSSMMDACPLLSPPSSTARSSYSSSLWTADTSSTLNSVYNPTLDDIMQEDISYLNAPVMSIAKFAHNSTQRTSKFSCNSIPEEQVQFTTHHHNLPQFQDTPPPVPAKPAKVVFGCTVCRKSFTRKDDWRRHEESHDPQKYWICMMNDPALPVSKGWLCVFCDTVKPNRNEIVVHLMKKHQINECSNKHQSARRWCRKDKLKQHLQQVHHLGEGSAGAWGEWNRDVTNKKWAWGCGFCGVCSFTWKGRVNHVAEHYEEQNLSVYQWSDSLVVKALLKQAYPDFNALGAWKARFPAGDKDLEWSKADADSLRRKLEFHEDTAEKVVSEAQVLALKFRADYDTVAWTAADSRGTTLKSSIDYAEVRKAPWQIDSKEVVSHIKVLSTYDPSPMNLEVSSGLHTSFF